MTRMGFEHHRMDVVELTYSHCTLLTPMRYTPFTPFDTTFAEILSRKGTCHAINHVAMMC